MKTLSRRSFVITAAAIAGAPAIAIAQAGKKMTTPSGLQIEDTKVGTGATPKTGQTCVMHYTGWLYENGAKGTEIRLIRRSRPAVRVSDRRRPGDQGLGRRCGHHAGRRQAHAHHPAGARLRRTRRGRRDPAERDAAVRGRTARREGLIPRDDLALALMHHRGLPRTPARRRARKRGRRRATAERRRRRCDGVLQRTAPSIGNGRLKLPSLPLTSSGRPSTRDHSCHSATTSSEFSAA